MCKWVQRNFFKIAVLVLIAIILLFSKSVIKRAFDLNEQLFYESAQSEQSSGELSLTNEDVATKTTACKTVEVTKPATMTEKDNCSFAEGKHTRVFLYHILSIVYICVLAAVFVILSAFLIKDTSSLHYAKLEELREIREKIETVCKSEPNQDQQDEKNCEKKTALFKHYMSCITEL